jgi:hypothetical protein
MEILTQKKKGDFVYYYMGHFHKVSPWKFLQECLFKGSSKKVEYFYRVGHIKGDRGC